MTATATQIFDFIDQNPSLLVERHEIDSFDFSVLRRALRQMTIAFQESDDIQAVDCAERLRMSLFEWLSAPVPLDGSVQTALRSIGTPDQVRRRWGTDIQSLQAKSLFAAERLASRESPLRVVVAEVINALRHEGKDFRIYCHRNVVPAFLSLPVSKPIEASDFIHSLGDYRSASPFDVLIKVGPLRGKGWGSVPDAVFTAPRFRTLRQIVWRGSSNEAGFGYDPAGLPEADSADGADAAGNSGARPGVRTETFHRVDVCPTPAEEVQSVDDFSLLAKLGRSAADCRRPAVLVQIDDHHGILYPPPSKILSYSLDGGIDEEVIDRRIPAETLAEGMLLIRAVLDDEVKGPAAQSSHGHYSRIWKERLRHEMLLGKEALGPRLARQGIDLANIDVALEHWAREPSTVIHAPRKRAHFEILVRTLGVPIDGTETVAAWTERAWSEIARGRGEAIHAGREESERTEDMLIESLRSVSDEIRDLARTRSGFSMPVPEGPPLHGTVMFDRVMSIDRGYKAPESELRVVRELAEVERWRA